MIIFWKYPTTLILSGFVKYKRKVLWFLLFYFDKKINHIYFIMNRSLINKSSLLLFVVLANTILVNLQSEIKFPLHR
jgi:hypothetical protein